MTCCPVEPALITHTQSRELKTGRKGENELKKRGDEKKSSKRERQGKRETSEFLEFQVKKTFNYRKYSKKMVSWITFDK